MELNSGLLNESGLGDPGSPPAPSAIPVSQWNETSWAFRIRLQQWNDGPFTSTAPIQQWNEAAYGARVLAFNSASWGNQVGAAWNEASFALRGLVQQLNEAAFDVRLRDPVAQWNDASWAARFGQWNEATWLTRERVQQWNAAEYAGTLPLGQWHEADFELREFNPVSRWNTALWDLESAEVTNITGAPYLLKDGEVIGITGADFAADEGGFFWTCNIELARVADYQRFKRNDPFEIDLFGDRYHFIVELKSIDRPAVAQVTMTLTGVSPAAVLDSPRARPVTKTWDTAMLASQIALEMAGSVPLDWQVLDWVIPANRLAVNGASPISVIQQLATACGGVVEADTDGGLVVRPEFPVTVPEWGNVSPDLVLTDKSHNLSTREGVGAADVYNRFYLSDTLAGAATDRIEFEADEADPYKGTLRVYPAVWRENLVVTSTRAGVILVPTGVISREEEETIEVTQGTGQTAFPIDAILGFEWLDRDLGGVSAGNYSSTVTAAGSGPLPKYSLLRIRYRTKAITYRTEYDQNGLAQFLVEEV